MINNKLLTFLMKTPKIKDDIMHKTELKILEKYIESKRVNLDDVSIVKSLVNKGMMRYVTYTKSNKTPSVTVVKDIVNDVIFEHVKTTESGIKILLLFDWKYRMKTEIKEKLEYLKERFRYIFKNDRKENIKITPRRRKE